MGRQFFSTRIDELESMFDRQRQDASFLDALLEELDHRSTQRSKDLLARAVQARGVLGKHSGEINPGDQNVDFREPGLTERSIRLRILSQRVDDGTLPARAANYARLKKIIYLGDLANSSPGEMLRTPNMGVGTVQAFRRRLQSKGLDWGCDTIGWSRAYAKQLEREASEAAERAKALSPKQRRALSERADDGKLPVRAEQYLRRRRITYIGELAQLSSDEIMQTLNMGRQSVAPLHQRLRAYGLDWNCDVGSWSRELARKLELQATEEAHHGEPTELGAALRQAVQEVATSERNVGIILWQRGWDGRGGATLEEVGKFHGMTRERVRQIVAKIERRLTNKAAPLALRRAVKIVKRTTPGNVEDVLSTLVREGVLAGSFDIRGLLNAADTWRLPLSLGFAGSHRTILAAPESITAIERIAQAARKACGARGCANLADFREAVTEAIGREPTNALIASAVWSDDLEWLDQSQGWFWRPIEPDSNRNRLVNKIRQVLAVADSIDLPELRTAARRHHRMGGFAPPTKILGEICRRLSFAEVKDGRIFSLLTPEQKEETLRGFNGDIAAILKRDGPLLSRLDLLERALAAGLNENTYNIYAGYSPILWRPAPGFYALVGAELPPGTVEAQQEISHERAATLISDRWLHGGGCQLAWLLGRGGALDGLVNVPSAYARFLQGDWELLDSAGQPLGRAQVGDATVWRLKPTLRRLGVEAGDVLTLSFLPAGRSCVLRLGGRELADEDVALFAAPVRDSDDDE